MRPGSALPLLIPLTLIACTSVERDAESFCAAFTAAEQDPSTPYSARFEQGRAAFASTRLHASTRQALTLDGANVGDVRYEVAEGFFRDHADPDWTCRPAERLAWAAGLNTPLPEGLASRYPPADLLLITLNADALTLDGRSLALPGDDAIEAAALRERFKGLQPDHIDAAWSARDPGGGNLTPVRLIP